MTTTPRRNPIKCNNCKREFYHCSGCGKEIFPDTNFSRWLRNLPSPLDGNQCSSQNLDYIWFSFYQNWFITVEEKTNGKEYSDSASDRSQIQSHGLIRQMLSFASGNTFDISFNSERIEKIEYRGHYVIGFDKTCPSDSKSIKINKEEYTVLELIYLLRTGVLKKLPQTTTLPDLQSILDIDFSQAIKIRQLLT